MGNGHGPFMDVFMGPVGFVQLTLSGSHGVPMTLEIKVGSILVRENIVFPPGVSVESEPLFSGWKLIRNLDGYALARIVAKADWHFFYLAGDIRAISFGRGGSAFRSALKRILAKREGQGYNALEITEVISKRFLGVPILKVRAVSRHIQESIGLVPTRNFVLKNPAWEPDEKSVTKRYTAMISSS